MPLGLGHWRLRMSMALNSIRGKIVSTCIGTPDPCSLDIRLDIFDTVVDMQEEQGQRIKDWM
jgi:hypothetical protein